MKSAALLLALVASCAGAEGITPSAVGLHIGSHHFQDREAGTWNNRNPGMYARWDSGLVVGTLRNSERRQSVYVAKAWQTDRWHGIALDLTAGGITGYERTVSPLLSVGASIAITETVSIRLSVLPKAAPKGSAAIHLSTEWSFK